MKFLLNFLILLLLISLAANAYLYLNPKEKIIVKQEMPKAETEKIREIASICGIGSEAFEKASLLSNLSDIKSTLWNNTRTCSVSSFSPEEIETIDIYLNNKPDILSKIKAQDDFIAPYSMKRILLLSIED